MFFFQCLSATEWPTEVRVDHTITSIVELAGEIVCVSIADDSTKLLLKLVPKFYELCLLPM